MIDPATPKRSLKSVARMIAIGRPRLGIMLMILLLAIAGILWTRHLRHDRLRDRLLAANPDAIVKNPQLTAFANAQAKPLYATHCARCHGADMTGKLSLGAPNLIDRQWLFGEGSIFDIERTLLYGIRSEHSKSHHVTDMPAFGLTGRLSDAEIRNLVQYLLQLSGQPHQNAAASEGRALYFDVAKANCGDCHGDSGRGNSNYGAPDLTDNAGRSSGDERSLYDAIYYGQHRVMPAWINVLTLEQIRALAVYVYVSGKHSDD
jgi:cytochrome c oxidase cbb3-type subunit III